MPKEKIKRFQSKGFLRYTKDPLKLVVEIDPQIAAYYRSLIPKWIVVNQPRYPPHITVVRNEKPIKMRNWGFYEGSKLTFSYEPFIHVGEVYCWLNVYAYQLSDIRRELGLSSLSDITRPPDNRFKCFHTTIANRKI